ncbi:MAG: hemolysin family protein [Phycisphaerales bacterium]|nr:hemolysin family protein [Phycisphaerales bacterium]
MTHSLLFWIFTVSLLLSLFFSTVSYSLRNMSRVQLEQALFRRRRSGALEEILTRRYDIALTASIFRLTANAAAIIAVAAYFHVGDGTAPSPHPLRIVVWTILISVPILVIISVAIPQAWARYAGEHFLATVWPVLRAIHFLLWPLVRVLNVFDEIVRRLSGVSIGEDPDTAAEAVEQEILAVVAEGSAEGAVDEESKKMIEGVISFRDLQVGQIMTPRTEVTAIDVNSPIPEVTGKIVKEGLSRVPVYEGTLDNIVGILYAKDLLDLLCTPPVSAPAPPPTAGGSVGRTPITIRQIMRTPLFVPSTKPLRDLLRELRNQRVHMAIVLDEYGGTSGLVTTEDIIEEIVGDIVDEYERHPASELKRIDARIVEVDARMNLSDLNRELGLSLPEDRDYHTIGGFVISTLGYIPAKGERLVPPLSPGLTLTVLEAEPRRINKLRLELPPPQRQSAPEEPQAHKDHT